jgi:xanthine dehydrogenase molybdenum-binding subunit
MGTKTTFAIIAAQVLGISPDEVKFVDENIDTGTVVFDKGTHASRSTYVGGNAVMLACAKVQEKLIDQGAKMLGLDRTSVVSKDGCVAEKDGSRRSLRFAEIVADAQFGKEPHLIDGEATWDQRDNAVTSGAQVAEVEVDLDTGKFKVLKIVAANDVGKIINPMSAKEQIEGAVIQGLGYALMENLRLDPVAGRLVNTNLREYKLPLMEDIPPIEMVNIERLDPTGPFGAKGIAELGIIPVAAAIRNAIFNATGVALNDLPLTPEGIREGLKAINRG